MEMLATATVTMIVRNSVTAAMMSAKNAAICQIANSPTAVMEIVVSKLPVAAGATVFVQFRRLTAVPITMQNVSQIPVMATAVDKLPAAAGAIVFVRKTMTAARMSAMNAISAARNQAGGGFNSW